MAKREEINMTDYTNVCAFCDKPKNKVKKLFAGSNGCCICDECIRIGYSVVDKITPKKQKSSQKQVKIAFTPEEVVSKLSEHVVGQDKAKQILSVVMYNHFKRINNTSDIQLTKSNVLMVGSSGSGKTLIAETLAKQFDLPIAIVDATSITEAGYTGGDVTDILVSLLNSAGGDVEKAQTGIVFIDEIDKKSTKTVGTRDVSGEGVQQALLRIVEGCTLSVPVVDHNSGQKYEIEMNTKNILFVVAGAFVGLIDSKKKAASSIGFGAHKPVDKAEDITTEDIIKYGIIPEFAGRFPIIAALDDLTEDALYRILVEPKYSIVNQFKHLFKLDGVELEFNEQYLRNLAKSSIEKKTGARGLRTLLEKDLLNEQYILPNHKKNGINKVYIDEHAITHHQKVEQVAVKRRVKKNNG